MIVDFITALCEVLGELVGTSLLIGITGLSVYWGAKTFNIDLMNEDEVI